MAHYHSRSYRKRRWPTRKLLYIISALLIIAAVNAFIRGSNTLGKNKSSASLTAAEVENETVAAELEPVLESDLLELSESTFESAPESNNFITEAMACIDAKPPRIIEARDRLNEALTMPIGAQQQAFVKKQLSRLAEKWLFSRTVFPQDRLCSNYKVKLSEQLRTIGRQFKVPYEILMQINSIARPKALQAGETIKVINGPFHAKIYRSAFTMDLYLQNTFVRSFSVGLGKPGMETPTGRWVVKPAGKLISPTWTDPATGKTYQAKDPDYPLGSRWIGLQGISGAAKGRTGFAIHGTKAPEEIGTAGSRGCIRLYNDDAILAYDLLMPGFSQVVIVE